MEKYKTMKLQIPDFDSWIQRVFGDSDSVRPDYSIFSSTNLELDQALEFGTHLFNHPRVYVPHFPRTNVIDGFAWMGSDRGIHRLLSESTIHQSIRTSCILSIYNLFKEQFSIDPLDETCFMWWESVWAIQPASGNSFHNDPYLRSCFIDVISRTLGIESHNCQMSALHGLGHLAVHHQNEVEPIINRFLVRSLNTSADVLEYAKSAMHGDVL